MIDHLPTLATEDGAAPAFTQTTGSPCLVLSLFPGIGLLDHAFELEGFTIVRGPDKLWGGDVRAFRALPGRFDGIIGGPPCQIFSRLRLLNPRAGMRHGNLIPEFERVCSEAQPSWFMMENVPEAPAPIVPGYVVHSQILNNRWVGGVQSRTRRLSFGTRDGRKLHVELVALESAEWSQTVTGSTRLVPVALGGSGKVKRTHPRAGPACGPRSRIEDMLRLQGLPEDWLRDCPFTRDAQQKVIGNGVPIPLGRALARGVRVATGNRD